MSDAHSVAVDAAATTQSDASHNLEAYIPGDRRHALATGTPMPDRVRGAALFADISGFTPLTEALANELGPQRGAEELTANLNRIFHSLIVRLERYGGHVIYFSGDSITCWIDGDDGARATACALAMQKRMVEIGEVVTPGGSTVRLAMKAAVAVGAARRFLVGDPDIQLIDVLAGQLIDALATAEHIAARTEVLLDRSALESLGDRVAIRELRVDPQSGRAFGVVARMTVPVENTRPSVYEDPLPREVVRQWLLPAVYERLSTGRGEFLAELRPAYPLFVRFGGINYDHDEDAIAKLDDFVRRAQRILTSYGGNLLHLTIGDKGAYLVAVFGPPNAHEDDAARASAAALELRELESTTAVTGIQVGITYGRLRSGTYGHRRRQTFTCLGDAVNLAARLMSSAPPGQIYASEPVRRAAGEVFTWEELPPLTVKGKAEPVSAFALAGSKRHATRAHSSSELPIIGRGAELETIAAKLDEALAGRGRIVGVSAEAGMGKSRLVAEFARMAEQRGAVVAVGECQSYGTNTSYFVWRTVWSSLFRLDDSRPEDEQVRALEAELAAIDPALVPRAPLLGGLLDLPIPDNDLTASFDAKLRKTSLEGLLVECLRARSSAGPVVLALEDCHWLDPLSRDLLEVLARALAGFNALVVLAYRPSTDVGGGLGIEKLPHFDEIALAELDDQHAAQLIRSKLEQMLGAEAEAPAALVELITARAQGNPFYIEELLNFIRSHGVDPQDEGALKKLELPESLHSLILSRIDKLGEAPRRTLKVASVLGRVFRAPMLPGIYPELGAFEEVREHLRTLGTNDLVNVDQEAEQSYLFKHVVTQEVAYESMPFAFRSMLHERVGGYIESSEAEAIDRNLDLLAHHYWHGENLQKKREYLDRAGDAAQASYANAAAIDYFERLAPLVEQGERVGVLLKLGKVLELVGNWHRAEQVDSEALGLAVSLGDDHSCAACETALAEVARKQGRYDEALERLDRAALGFRSLGEEGGVGRVLHLVGTVAAQRGDYAKAVENYEASLAIRERVGDKGSMGSLLSNLGVIAEYRGDYPAARTFHERALALRTEIGDRWAIGVSMNNLGMIAFLQRHFPEAREWFQKSMRLCREVGDAWMVAIGHNNLGNATRGLGDYAAARRHYADSLRAYRDYDDRWALAFLLEDIGILAALDGDAQSGLQLMGAADASREAIGAPRAPSLEEEIARQLAPALTSVSDQQQLAWRLQGRSLELAAAVDHALALCGRASRDSPPVDEARATPNGQPPRSVR
jgi:class 3 adenylate cyclase/tetratricopeptide (TPR) repeat protein